MIQEIEKVIEKHLNTKNPGVALCFTIAPEYNTCHWATNISRQKGIALFYDTAAKMQVQIN